MIYDIVHSPAGAVYTIRAGRRLTLYGTNINPRDCT
jgi:hypothetical protein